MELMLVRLLLFRLDFQASQRLNQMEGSGGPGAQRELGKWDTAAAGREVRPDDPLHKVLDAEVTCCY